MAGGVDCQPVPQPARIPDSTPLGSAADSANRADPPIQTLARWAEKLDVQVPDSGYNGRDVAY